MTVQNIFDDFRIQARDLVKPNRYRDALCLIWYNDGLREIHDRRPEVYEGIEYEDDTIPEATSTSDTFPFYDCAKRMMVLHMLRRSAEYNQDFNLAREYMNQFNIETRGF